MNNSKKKKVNNNYDAFFELKVDLTKDNHSSAADKNTAITNELERLNKELKSKDYLWFKASFALNTVFFDILFQIIEFILGLVALNMECEKQMCSVILICTSLVLICLALLYVIDKPFSPPTLNLVTFVPEQPRVITEKNYLERDYLEWEIEGGIVKVYFEPDASKRVHATIGNERLTELETSIKFEAFNKELKKQGLSKTVFTWRMVDWKKITDSKIEREKEIQKQNEESKARTEAKNAEKLRTVNEKNAERRLKFVSQTEGFNNNMLKFLKWRQFSIRILTFVLFIISMTGFFLDMNCSSGVCKATIFFPLFLNVTLFVCVQYQVNQKLSFKVKREVVNVINDSDRYSFSDVQGVIENTNQGEGTDV